MNSVEVLMGSHYDVKADVFSYAISFFEALTCKKPYSDNENKTRSAFVFMKAIQDGMRPESTLLQPEDVLNLIHCCWDAVPKQRPSMKKVLRKLEYIVENRYFI